MLVKIELHIMLPSSPPPDQVSLYLWGTRPGDQAPSTNGNIQLIIQCFGFYNSAPRIRRSNPAWLWAFLRLLVSIHQSPWWYVYQSKKWFYFIMKRTELFWLTFWCPNFYSRLGKLLLIKVNLLKIVSVKIGRDENVSKMDVDSVDSVDGRRPNVDQDLDQ